MQMLIDAGPIIADLAKKADRPKGKNPYENIRIAAYREVLDRIMNAQIIEPVNAAGGCYCAECRFLDGCGMVESLKKTHGRIPPFCSLGEVDPDLLDAPSLGELAGRDTAGKDTTHD